MIREKEQTSLSSCCCWSFLLTVDGSDESGREPRAHTVPGHLIYRTVS